MQPQNTSLRKAVRSTEAYAELLANARHVMATKHAGKSPTARGEEKLIMALNWVYRWGWSSAKTIDRVGGSKGAGLAARLVRAQYLVATRTASGLAQRDLPSHILTLTQDGLSRIQRERDILLPYSTDPARVRQDQLRHYQIAQTATLKALQEQRIVAYNVEKELAEVSADGVKQPDVVWYLPGDTDTSAAVEIELSPKWGRAMDVFVRGCSVALTPTRTEPARFDFVFIISDSSAIIKRYSAALSAGSTYELWQKDAGGHMIRIKDSTQRVSAEVAEKVLCRNLND